MTLQASIINIIDSIQTSFLGNREAVELAVCAFLSGGHLLIEDVPGVGKTTLAKAMAVATGGKFSRIQFTSDLLPSDILGISVWNVEQKSFEFQAGPIFANVILADEINRASPKTQSALLEAMSERQVSQEGVTHPLPHPFLVVATQNVTESYGTYPLPESQLDRFSMKIQLGYTTPSVEKQIILSGGAPDAEQQTSGVSPMALVETMAEIQQTKVEDSIIDYLMAIIEKTRHSQHIACGASPRSGIALLACARVYAQLRGRQFVVADDIQKLAIPVLAHRMIGSGQGGPALQSEQIKMLLSKILHSVEVPI